MSPAAWCMASLYAISLLVNANQHGKPQEPTNFWIRLFSVALSVALLWWGGFWS